MIEIRFHGRGGQGAVVASNILAKAAAAEGMDVQSFPYFGVERRGAPVTAYTRIDKQRIRLKSQIYEPDYVLVLDPFLMEYIDVTEGLKENGALLVNTHKKPSQLSVNWKGRVYTIDATKIALKHHLGTPNAPIVNTSILGTVPKLTGMVSWESLKEMIYKTVPVKKEENVKAAEEAYNTFEL
ncbi:MAG TPA: pyruvate ferredoxin oxidoreductase [Thermoplasmata archaeon]|nr:pyruvate ferredoxin oxidoreductase [Thermoplasmata archaeon]